MMIMLEEFSLSRHQDNNFLDNYITVDFFECAEDDLDKQAGEYCASTDELA
jgi:hypothetical protein